jgi:Protein of unknown function (DUF559)
VITNSGQSPAQPPLVLTRAGARQTGLPLKDLLGGGYQRLFYDAYVPSTIKITPLLRARVVLRRLPNAAWISHHTAIQIWGGVAPTSPEIHVTMTDRNLRCRRQGIAAHYCDPGGTTSSFHGVAVSTPTQAFLELAATGASLVDLVIAGDSLVKVTQLTPEAFIEAADECLGNKSRLARRAARLIRLGVDSPMETRVRLLVVFAGLPEPEVNFILRDEQGHWQRRFDMCYRDLKLIIEYDGRQHAEDDHQWGSDIERREELDRLGWRLIIVRADGIYRYPERTLAKIQTALRDRGAVRIRTQLRAEWMQHFPGQG